MNNSENKTDSFLTQEAKDVIQELLEINGGGGGGTSDYDDLTNKPSINGVSLSGDMSADDLGLAETSDIPDVSGLYTKPNDGIPKSDLASDVKTSLDKADTALQSFTETDPTVPSWAKAVNKPTYTASEVGALPVGTAIPSIDNTLTTQGAAADAKATGDAISGATNAINNINSEISEMVKSVNGVSPDANGNVDVAVDQTLVDNWLDEHPEATTTVQDGSITYSKLNSEVSGDISGLKNALTYNTNNILYGIDYGVIGWGKGGLNGANPDSYRSACRIHMTNYYSFNEDTIIAPTTTATGIYGVALDSEGNPVDIWAGYKNQSVIIPKNTKFKIAVDAKIGQPAVDMTVEQVKETFTVDSELYSVEEIQDKLNQISPEIVPSYYFDNDYLMGKTLNIQKSARYNGIKFGFISDAHVGESQSTSMVAAKYIKDNSSALPFMIYGGDTITTQVGTEDRFYQQIEKWEKQIGIFGKERVFQCRGNHDYSGRASGVDISGTIGLCVSGVIGNHVSDIVPAYKNALSYYFDIPQYATRIIVVDNYANQGESNFSGYVAMNAATANWIQNVALNISDYNVIVVSHQPLNLYGDSEDYASGGSLKPLKDCLTAFKNHTSVNSSYGAVVFNKDFSTNTSKLICLLSGHKHTDFIGGMADFMTIGIASDCTAYDPPGYGKKAGTITSGLFDCLAFDYPNAKAYATRIGAGYDRIFHYDATLVSGTETLDSELSGTLTWASDDTSVATVTGGTVTGVATGSCIVSATDETGVKEAWLIKV